MSAALENNNQATGELLNGYEFKYYRFLQRRKNKFEADFQKFGIRCVKDLVTVVLPVYNGDDMVDQSIESILCQTYGNFELIIIDDGSTDKTPEIVDAWAEKDQRIRVVHQKNSKLPRALNRGFSMAEGEFLTWTSADNVMHENFLEKLTDFMKRSPDLAMCYGNVRAIDGKGAPLTDLKWYDRGESEGVVYLPNAVLRLNTYPENTICAAFMYRRAVPALIGGYDPLLYTVEDYDYWMRINDFFSLSHVDFEEAIYDYRFHEKSLTAQAKELHINDIRDKLMLSEDFRQDYLIHPMCWVCENGNQIPGLQDYVKKIGHIERTPQEIEARILPKLGNSLVQISFSENGETVHPGRKLTEDALRILICRGKTFSTDEFDLKIQLGRNLEDIPQDYVRALDEKTAFDLVQIYAKSHWYQMYMNENRKTDTPSLKATIVLCTYKRVDAAEQSLKAMVSQTADHSSYEVLVVNNDPADRTMYEITEAVKKNTDVSVRYIDCPFPGLSAARNASVYEAQGGYLLYVDDDGIMEPDCLQKLLEAVEAHPEAGVIGGQILLKDPERFKDVILPGYESVWSERRFDKNEYFNAEYEWDYPYGCNYGIRRSVLRDLGGFRVTYGRNGKDFSGGEEMVLSHLVKKSGMEVGLEPRAIIHHDVEESRYTLEHVKKTLRAGRLTNQLMKLDLYRDWDPYMKEETAMLQMSEQRLADLRKAGASDDDLRVLYCLYEIEGTKDALRQGQKYQEEREAASRICTAVPSYVPAPELQLPVADIPRSRINRMATGFVGGIGKLLGRSSLGRKATNFSEFIRDNGVKNGWKELFPRKKSREEMLLEGLQAAALERIACLEAHNDAVSLECRNDLNQKLSDHFAHYDAALEKIQAELTESLRDSQKEVIGFAYDFECRLKKTMTQDRIRELRARKKILIVGSAEHKNIGDAAITLAEQDYFLCHLPEYEQVEFSTYHLQEQYDFFQAILNRDDIIIINGGGNMGSLYPPEENMHQKIVEDFPDNKIVVLPQTLCYREDAAGRKYLQSAERIYNRHKHLTIFARGQESFDFAKAHFSGANVEMLPDMTVCLQRGYDYDREGILLCLRNDREKLLSAGQTSEVLEAARSFGLPVTEVTNMHDRDIERQIRAAVVNDQLRRFAKHRIVVTDRLHGVLFAALTRTPVVVLKSGNHKITEFCETYLSDSNAVFYVGGETGQIRAAMEQAMHVTEPHYELFAGDPLKRIEEVCRE